MEWAIYAVGLVLPLYYLLYVIQVRFIGPRQDRKERKQIVSKEIQDEIEQNFAWWDRQFAALSKEAFPGQARLPEHYLYPKTTPNEYLEKFGIDPRNVPADERYCTPEGYYMFVRDLQGKHVIENGQTKKRFQPWPAGFDYWGAWRNAVNSQPSPEEVASYGWGSKKMLEYVKRYKPQYLSSAGGYSPKPEDSYTLAFINGDEYVMEAIPAGKPKGQHVYAMPTVGPKGGAGDSGAAEDQAYELPAPIYIPSAWRESEAYKASRNTRAMVVR